jgi:hypothetical protein
MKSFGALELSGKGNVGEHRLRGASPARFPTQAPSLGPYKVMKAFLMHKGRDFDLERKPPPHHEALTQDLGLNALFNAMALRDPFLLSPS